MVFAKEGEKSAISQDWNWKMGGEEIREETPISKGRSTVTEQI
jgi:hypothetical protein